MLIFSRSVLRMRVEREEHPWAEVRFELKDGLNYYIFKFKVPIFHSQGLHSQLALMVCLSSGSENGLNPLRLPQAISITKGVRFALAPLYLGFLYTRTNKSVGNTIRVVGRYDIVVHVDPQLLVITPLGEVLNHRPDACGVSRSGHRGGDVGKWLDLNEDTGHIQASGMEVAKHKAICQ